MEQLLNCLGYFFVLARKQLWSTLQNGDTASEADERLREFQPYIAATQNDQMAGKPIQFEYLDMRQRVCGAKALDVGNSCVSA
jgi:hypothetical protein